MNAAYIALAALPLVFVQDAEPLKMQIFPEGMAVRCTAPSGCVVMTIDEFQRIPAYVRSQPELRKEFCSSI